MAWTPSSLRGTRPASAGQFSSLSVSLRGFVPLGVLVGWGHATRRQKKLLHVLRRILHLPLTAPRLHIDIDDFYGPRGAEETGWPAAAAGTCCGARRARHQPLAAAAGAPARSLGAARPFRRRASDRALRCAPADPSDQAPAPGSGDLQPRRRRRRFSSFSKQTVVFRQSQITVDYKDGGNPLDLRVNKVNTLRDNDIVTTLHHNDLDDSDVVTDADAESVAWPDHDIMPIAELAQMAEPHIPDAYAGATATRNRSSRRCGRWAIPGPAGHAARRRHDRRRRGWRRCTLAAGSRRPGAGSPVDNDANMAVVETGAEPDRKLRCRHRRAGRHRHDDRAR